MQRKQNIRKFFSILLIVVFSVKAGMGLYLHNNFHSKDNTTTSTKNSATIEISCSCMADFCLPFTEALEQKIDLAHSIYENDDIVYTIFLPDNYSLFLHLRGPPIVA